MSIINLLTAFLAMPFLLALVKASKEMKINIIPIISILAAMLSLVGTVLFPEPNKLNPFFGNIIIPIILGPLLAIFMWRRKDLSQIRLLSLVSFVIMITPLILIIERPAIPVFVNNYFGLIQRFFYLGWSFWFVSLSFCFSKLMTQKINVNAQNKI